MGKLMATAVFVCAVAVCFCGTAHAQPYLVCDYPSDAAYIDYYEVDGLPSAINGRNIPVDSTKKYGFRLDLKALSAGSYKIVARACNTTWGCSADSDPFEFQRPSELGKPKPGLTR